ncbi:hypothetical protein F1640_18285 [Novosphingobium sp. NBM11]|uniref:hypothetical protein n=1 Tax=Novosphingobium sp. NBM11 TaxID=2596914 RepID=UPI0018924B24|nr:hypothetical protein [Novosphingobium sp. NBM11]MBF5091904.1 hypothetical protein [Novosphingobium sp. NBM11]
MAGLGSSLMQPTAQTPAAAPMSAQPAPAAQDDQGGMDAGGQQAASPEEQAELEKFVRAMQAVIYPDATPGEVYPQIIADLKGQFDKKALDLFDGVEPPLTNSPQDCVSATAVLITIVVDQKFGLLNRALDTADSGQQPKMENEPNEEQPGQPEEDRAPEASGEDEQDFSPEAVLYQAGREAVEEMIEISEAAKLHDFNDQDIEGAFLRALDLFRVAATKINPRIVDALKTGFAQLVDADRAGQLNKILPGLPGGQPIPAGQPQAPQQGAA